MVAVVSLSDLCAASLGVHHSVSVRVCVDQVCTCKRALNGRHRFLTFFLHAHPIAEIR